MVLKNSFGNSAEVHKHNLCIHKFDSGRGKRRMGERERERERPGFLKKRKEISYQKIGVTYVKLNYKFQRK